MLHLDGIRAQAGSFALEADWQVDQPLRIAVVGPSGAGKSTLLDVIAGFRAPTGGRVRVAGRDVTDEPPAARGMSILFQDNNLFPHLTVAQNLQLALRPRGGRLTAAQQARRDQALAQVDLAGLGGRRPADLSGGQQSRAALARILVQDHPVVALDEPFAALGPGLRAELLDRVVALTRARDQLSLMVTHDPGDISRFADAVVLVDEGRAQAPVRAQQFLADPPPAYRRYLGDGAAAQQGRSGPVTES